MYIVEQEIWSSPPVLRKTLTRVRTRAEGLANAQVGPAVFMGCGTSHFVGMAAADLYKQPSGFPAQGVVVR